MSAERERPKPHQSLPRKSASQSMARPPSGESSPRRREPPPAQRPSAEKAPPQPQEPQGGAAYKQRTRRRAEIYALNALLEATEMERARV